MSNVRRHARAACLAAALVLLATPALASQIEEVRITHAGLDDAVVERPSGERWWLDVRQTCFPLRSYVGRTVLAWAPSLLFRGETRLLLPELGTTCPVWSADSLGGGGRPLAPPEPVEGLRAMREALELLGYDCGPPGREWTPEAGQAFTKFRETKRLDSSLHGLRRAVTSLALDTMRGRQTTGTALRLSRIMSDHLDPLVERLSRPGPGNSKCSLPTWIRRVAEDGSLVRLADDTSWVPARKSWPVVAGWQASDDVFVCSSRLVNWRTGEMVYALPEE
jgi:hypothetical protein